MYNLDDKNATFRSFLWPLEMFRTMALVTRTKKLKKNISSAILFISISVANNLTVASIQAACLRELLPNHSDYNKGMKYYDFF
jgi:hypothetical protein